MKWLKVSVPVRPWSADAVAHHLVELGSQGVQQGEDEITAYYPVDHGGGGDSKLQQLLASIDQRLEAVRAAMGVAAAGEVVTGWVDPEDWAESWKPSYKPVATGGRVVIVPAWLRDEYQAPAGAVPVWMEPGMAFGTGEHASTRLALVLLQQALERARAGATGRAVSVADIGTGSGILAIAAARLAGAGVWACDNDETSIRVARANAHLNGVAHQVVVEIADLFQLDGSRLPAGPVDVLVSNILFSVLRDGAPNIISLVRPGGLLVLSGIITNQRDRLVEVYEQFGCRREMSITVDGWSAVMLKSR